MPDPRSIVLRVHFGRDSALWTLMTTRHHGATMFDRHIHSGPLAYEGPPHGPQACLGLLQAALDAATVLAAPPAPPKASAPPLGAMGGGAGHWPVRRGYCRPDPVPGTIDDLLAHR